MKRILLLSFVLCSFIAHVSALHKTYMYDISELQFVNDTIENQIYSNIVWSDSYNENAEIGYPSLPIFHHIIEISESTMVDSVTISLSNSVSGVLNYHIKPMQYPIPTSLDFIDQAFVKNEDVYQQNTELPINNLVSYRTDLSRDKKTLSLSICPFKYNPSNNTYTAYSVADIEIYTHETTQQTNRSVYTDIGLPYYEYVIITNSSLVSAFEPFAQWKRAKGYNVGIVDIADILSNSYLSNGDLVSGINDDAGKLRQYLIYSYNSVGTKYALLGGDVSVVPIRYAAQDSIPSDFYYSELNSNWDYNNNGYYGEYSDITDYGAEIYVGRLLCTSATEVKNWIAKLLRYEINPGNGDYSYLGRALFSQADQMQRDSEAESIQQKLIGNITCTILNEYPSYNAYSPTFPMGYDIISDINETHYGLLGNFNHGSAIDYGVATNACNLYGHDVHHNICAFDSYDTHDEWLYSAMPDDNNGFDNLTNGHYPSIMYSISCSNMPFDSYETPDGTYNLGKVFTCKSNGGGPAYLGNTRTGYVGSSTQLYQNFLDTILLNIDVNHIGIAEALSKFKYRVLHLIHAHNILGCPEMSLYTRVPSTFSINVNISNNHMYVSTGAASVGTRICLSGYVNGVYTQYVVVNNNTATFNTIPDNYSLVISKPNYIPYILTSDNCYLQDEIITSNQTIGGCSIFTIGSDVTPLKPYGKVEVENGSTLTIQNGGSVIIKNDFEVKLGGQLIIQ